jgi:hypothetical protein
MALPFTKTFAPLDILLASDMNGLMSNDTALANGTGLSLGASTVPGSAIVNGSIPASKLNTPSLMLTSTIPANTTGISTLSVDNAIVATFTAPSGVDFTQKKIFISLMRTSTYILPVISSLSATTITIGRRNIASTTQTAPTQEVSILFL